MKTKEELSAIKEEFEALSSKLRELTEEELTYITGSASPVIIQAKGKIIEEYPNQRYLIMLENGNTVIGHISGKLRMNYIRIITGDEVTVELSPYDLQKGHITWRNK